MMRASVVMWITVAFLIALAVASPLVAHAIGSPCWIWLPAHWPALVAGLALGFRVGLAVGVATMITELFGRSAIGAVPAASEMLVYGMVAGLAGDRARTIGDRYAGVVVAMIAGRVAYALVALIVVARPLAASLERLIVFPWPGVVVQLVAAPIVATALARVVRGVDAAGRPD